MKRQIMKTSTAILLIFFSTFTLMANWPEFRGPTGDGFVPAGGKALPTEWSEEKNITWKIPIAGAGWSTPAINEGRVWITTATLDGREMSGLCLDAKTGEILLDRGLRGPDLEQLSGVHGIDVATDEQQEAVEKGA